MERGEKIYTFIMPEIEVPPVSIKSTVGSERLERLIMLSTARNLFRFMLFSVQIGIHLPPSTPPPLLFFPLYPRRDGFYSATSVPPPLDSHAPARPCDGGQTASPLEPQRTVARPVSRSGAIPLCIFFPFINQLSLKKKNYRGGTSATAIHSACNSRGAQQQEKKAMETKR